MPGSAALRRRPEPLTDFTYAYTGGDVADGLDVKVAALKADRLLLDDPNPFLAVKVMDPDLFAELNDQRASKADDLDREIGEWSAQARAFRKNAARAYELSLPDVKAFGL